MNDENIVAMNKAISRTNGLYQKWFQEHTINSYLVQTLNALYMEPELSQSEISDYYKIPRQTVNNAIQTLRRWGYIELLPDERDKRWKRILICAIRQRGQYMLRKMAMVIYLFAKHKFNE